MFYRHVAESLAARVPRCHLAVASEDWHEFTLLLEDMAPATQGDQIAGADPAAVLLAATNLAGVHGPRWCDPTLWDVPHVAAVGKGDAEFLAAVFDDAVAPFLEWFGPALDAGQRATLQRVTAGLARFLLDRAERFSVLHGDYRLDNLLFAPDRSVVAAVDWQTMTVGLPARDLAYLLATSLESADRRAVEDDVIAAYHEALRGHGVDDYPLADLHGGLPGGDAAGSAHHGARRRDSATTARGDAMFTVMARRSLDAVAELGSVEPA